MKEDGSDVRDRNKGFKRANLLSALFWQVQWFLVPLKWKFPDLHVYSGASQAANCAFFQPSHSNPPWGNLPSKEFDPHLAVLPARLELMANKKEYNSFQFEVSVIPQR